MQAIQAGTPKRSRRTNRFACSCLRSISMGMAQVHNPTVNYERGTQPFFGGASRFRGAHLRELAVRVWKAMLADRIFGHAAELGFYFLFALFPTLLCAASILGFIARSAHQISDRLLEYLAFVVPTSAL